MSEQIEATIGHLDAARDGLVTERAATATKVLAAGRFALDRMLELGNTFDKWVVDDWELIAAEVGVELGISRGRALTLITQGRDLLTRLPNLAEVWATGVIDLRVIRLVLHRTTLILDEDILAVIDTQLADAAPGWNVLSDDRISELIDWMIIDVDPEAVRRAREARKSRFLTVNPVGDGVVEIYGRLDAADGAILDQSLDALASTVCPDDPRTHAERRADAARPLSLGATSIECLCGLAQCPAAGNTTGRANIIVHVLADRKTLVEAQARRDEAAACEEQCAATTPDPEQADTDPADPAEPAEPDPVTAEPISAPRPAALIPGYGPITTDALADLLPYATIRPLADPQELGTENHYQTSRALTAYLGCRDLTCRWPGCNVPIQRCDTDHTVPWPYGPTHPSNTKGYCRIHHLIKTFHCGPGGWNDQQHPDGTITITAPNGRVYTTKPGGSLFYPQLATPTADLGPLRAPPPRPHRELAAPKRSRTRAQSRAYRIAHERALNRAD
ncbi:DUF222 domain-containing protein, partial [Mycobacterium sp. C31M]